MNELDDRELFIAMLITDGLKNKDVAVMAGTSECMIKNRLRRIYDKLGLWNRTELALWYVKNVEHGEKKCKAHGAS